MNRGAPPRTGGEVIFVLAHRNHWSCQRPVLRELVRRGVSCRAAVPREAPAKGRLAASQMAELRQLCPVVELRGGLVERAMRRLRPGALTRSVRWTRRFARAIAGGRLRPGVVVLPIHSVFSLLRQAVGESVGLVALQQDPFPAGSPRDTAERDVDVWCVWGTFLADRLHQHGVRARVVITGAPHLERRLVDSRPHLRPERLSLLYATQPTRRMTGTAEGVPEGAKRRAIADLADLLLSRPDLSAVVKLHPVDDGSIEREVLAGTPRLAGRIRIAAHDPSVSIDSFLRECDLLVTLTSTVALEAVSQGRPVVLLDYDGIFADAVRRFDVERDYLREGAALAATDRAELERSVAAALHDKATRQRLREGAERLLDRHLRYAGPDAAGRVCDQIEALLGAGRGVDRGPAAAP